MIKKILVVDDDFLIRKWLCLLLQKSTGRKAEIYQAENGYKALEILQNNRMDLVITDIKMPVLDGVELIRRIRKLEWQPQIVALSSYDDYDYVRAALKEGVLDYLLKGEIELQDIDALIDLAEREISRRAVTTEKRTQEEMADHKLSRKFCEYMDNPARNMFEFLTFAYGKRPLFPIESIAFCIDDPQKFQFSSADILSVVRSGFKRWELDCSILPYRAGVFFLLYYRQTEAEGATFSVEYMRRIGKELENGIQCKIAGLDQRRIYSPEQIRVTLQKQLSFVTRMRFYQSLQIPQTGSPEQEVAFLTESKKKIFVAVSQKQFQRTKELLSELLQACKSSMVAPELLINSCIAICYRLSACVQEYVTTSYLQMIEDAVFQLQNVQTSSGAAAIMDKLLDSVQQTSHKFHKYSPAIEKSMDYIAAHYAEKLSLEQVSRYVYLNKSYFSELFKKETGINYNDYINQVRIEKACELLVGNRYTLSQIAQIVGFSDQNYFSKIFKRIKGESPKTYQKNYRETE